MSELSTEIQKAPGSAPWPRPRKIVQLQLAPAGQGQPAIEQSKVFRVNKERIVIGSVISADVRLSGDGVAPIHAVIEMGRDPKTGEEFATLYDLASDTGIFVNDTKVVTRRLQPGDKVTVGWHFLHFNLEDPGAISPKELFEIPDGQKLFLNPGEDFRPLLLQEGDDERPIQEIFDYRPASKPALEVIMSWHGTILEIEHFVDERDVTIGQGKRSDFAIPPLLSSKRYAIVSRQGENFVLNLDPQMKGVMQRAGELQTFEQIRAKSPASGSIPITIGREEFAKVSLGEIDFYLSYTAAPPRLKRTKAVEPDPLFWKVFGSSMLFTAITVVTLINARLPQSLETEQIPDRIATILYQPEKYVHSITPQPTATPAPTPTPKPKTTPKPTPTMKITPKPNPTHTVVPKHIEVPKPPQHKAVTHAQNASREGEGARHKGATGTRGSPHAQPNPEHQERANRPSPQGGKGAGGNHSQVNNMGNVDMLQGATSKIENLLSGSTRALGKGGDRFKGFGGFTTQGNGGLALEGTGKGGGGDAESMGLGKKGVGGGKVGTGAGAVGNGNDIVGGRTRVTIQSGGPEEAVVMGAIDANAVEAALLLHRDEFRYCYEKEINAGAKIAGRVGTSFVIGASGRVTQAGVESSSLKSPTVERCILSVIKRIHFPSPRGGGVVQVAYPFKFSPTGGG